jgi:hypothetical protein
LKIHANIIFILNGKKEGESRIGERHREREDVRG